MRKVIAGLAVGVLILMCSTFSGSAKGYENFKVAIYAPARDVNQMGDANWLATRWDEITRQVKVDKIYLETHRSELLVDVNTVLAAKKFFEDKGVEVAGGITYTIKESIPFQTFCYTRPEQRKKAKEIAEYTARLFDEIILDDFFLPTANANRASRPRATRAGRNFGLT
jgi:hypothetical protein